MLGKGSGRFVLGLLLLLTAAGAYFSWELNYKALKGASRGSAFISNVCTSGGQDENACTAVANSRWGHLDFLDPDVPEVVRALPTAYLGFAYFCMLFIWLLFVGRPNYVGRAWHLLPMLLTLIGVAVSAGLWYVMATQLSVTCPWCVVIHLINFVVFAGTVLLWPRKPVMAESVGDELGVIASEEAPAAAFPSFRLGSGVLLLAFAVASVGFFYSMDRRMAAQVFRWKSQNDRLMSDPKILAILEGQGEWLDIPIRDDDPHFGPWDAPHTLTVFTDFECPACAQLHRSLPRFMRAFRLEGRQLVRVVYKYAALCMDCNPNVDESAHPNACEAARAAEAARVMGGNEMFWKMADKLYSNQEALGKIDYADLATEIGLDAGEFRKTMESKAVYKRVDEDITLGKAAKSHIQTPTLFRDNRSWRMWTTKSAWNDWKDKVKSEAEAGLSPEQTPTRPAVTVQPNP